MSVNEGVKEFRNIIKVQKVIIRTNQFNENTLTSYSANMISSIFKLNLGDIG